MIKVGDVCVIINPDNTLIFPEWAGREVTCVGELKLRKCISMDGFSSFMGICYQIEAPWLPPCRAEFWAIAANNLIKRRDPPNWNDIAYGNTKPQELHV